MVTGLNHLIALMRLIRWQNLLIIAIVQILIRQFVMKPLAGLSGMELQLSPVLMATLVMATVFIAAGGYAINDYFDRKIDLINKPDRVVIGKLIYPHHVMAYHLGFTITGIVLGTLLSFFSGSLYLSIIFLTVGGLLWFYSTTYKQQVILGTVIISLLTALVPFIVLLYEMPLLLETYGTSAMDTIKNLVIWVSGFSLFAFLLNFAREIVKDAEDFAGDAAFKKNTLPVVAGMRWTKFIFNVVIAIAAALLILSYLIFIPDIYTLVYFSIFLILPLTATAIKVNRARTAKSYRQASTLIKFIIIMGILYMLMVNIIIKSLA